MAEQSYTTSTYPYRFYIVSDPKLVDMVGQSAASWKRTFYQDSMNAFFPYLECFYTDNLGIFSEAVHFVEGLEFDTVLEYNVNETGEEAIKHRMFWSENHQINNVRQENVQGDNGFYLLSAHRKKDSIKSESYKKKISGVVADAIKIWETGQGRLAKKVISATGNNDYWYQDNKLTAHFLQLLAEQAVSNDADKSPYYTFINLHNEFYFATVEEMMAQSHIGKKVQKQDSENKEAGVFRLMDGSASQWDPFVIHDYDLLYSGFPVHEPNYRRIVYNYDSDGVVTDTTCKIEDHLSRISDAKSSVKGKAGILKTDLSNYSDGSSHVNFGIKDENDSDNLKGFQNHFYKDSSLSYRIMITVPYNFRIAAGRVLRLRILSNDDNRAGGLSEEFSGEWLCIGSKHLMGADGRPWTYADIAKSTITFNNDHNFFSNFI